MGHLKWCNLTYIFDKFTFNNGHFHQSLVPGSISMRGQILVSGPLNDDLKQLLLRQLYCKWPFSWSRLHPSSCSATGSVKDRGVLTIILSGCVINWYDLKQLLSRQLHCKWPFSWSRLHLSSCSLTGSVKDRGVLTTILSGCVIKWYDLKQLLLRQLHCKWPFSLSRLHPSSSSPTGSVEDKIGFDLRTSKYMLVCVGG